MDQRTISDPFASFKSAQREVWAGFGANEAFTTPPAAALVRFAAVAPGEVVLDVGTGTGVAAITAARAGGRVKGLDLTPGLLVRARENAAIAGVKVELEEGDAEALPYPDASFDVVMSQFGHMFAPRPEVATAEMLRVLKPGGRIAFSTWPPEHTMGKLFALVTRNAPAPPSDAPRAAPPMAWGDPSVVRQRLGEAVHDLRFERGVALAPALSPRHVLGFLEATFGPLTKLLAGLAPHADRAATVRAEVLEIVAESFEGNVLRQQFLMSCARKRG